MEKTPAQSSRTLIITVIVGVILLHAALFTALAFRTDSPAPSGLPPLPPGLAAPATPQPAAPQAAPTTRPSSEPLRVSPPGPVGMASDAPLPATKGLTGGGKALGQ
jgi:hypothetical protein